MDETPYTAQNMFSVNPNETSSPPSTVPNSLPNSTNIEENGKALRPTKVQTRKHSEHDHFLHPVGPMSKHSGASVVTFFNGLFTTIIGISTLGASITFSYVLSNTTPPPLVRQPMFDVQQIQLFLSISWLLFLLSLAFASLGSTLLTFFKTHLKADWDGLHGHTSQIAAQMYAIYASSLLGALTVGAFAVLCLVVVAYSPVVGWTGLGFIGLFGLIILAAVVYQIPWPWRTNTPSEEM